MELTQLHREILGSLYWSGGDFIETSQPSKKVAIRAMNEPAEFRPAQIADGD
jgi:hypothetical protein